MKMNKRDYGIEALKAFAALIVMNSHMDLMYGDYSFLGTGGAIGDALFFFCSGYTLFWGRPANFLNWYKRRIQRIYPTVLAIAFISATYGMNQIACSVLTNIGATWFVGCIFLYYILLYPIMKYMKDRMYYIMAAVSIVSVLWYWIIGIEKISLGNIYGATYFKWCFYFMFTLLGSICGKSVKEGQTIIMSIYKSTSLSLLSVVLFYGIYLYTLKNGLECLQLISIIPLMSLCYYLWHFTHSDAITFILNQKVFGGIIIFIGGLCLELYLSQGFVFTTKLNFIFPLNIPIIMVVAIFFAYIVRCISRFILQTFQIEDYNWKKIIEPYIK